MTRTVASATDAPLILAYGKGVPALTPKCHGMLLDEHAHFARRDVQAVARLDREAFELIASELGVDRSTVRPGQLESDHRSH